jgi:hypothetical protein
MHSYLWYVLEAAENGVQPLLHGFAEVLLSHDLAHSFFTAHS